ncbi:MAG: FkbM family methyltransferase [Candidatus Thorarchaeota archaeon]
MPKTPLVRGRILGHDMIIPNTGRHTQGHMMNTLRGNLHEPETTDLIVRNVKLGQTVIDIGANVGYYTLLLARAVGPEGLVYAFEPNPVLARILQHNIRQNSYRNVIVIEKAVSDVTGSARFYIDTQVHERGSLNPTRGSEIIEVDIVPLDVYLQDSSQTISWIKLDVEGHEGAALRGMRRVLRISNDIRLIIEFIPTNPGFDADALFAELEGFSFRTLDHNLYCWRAE